MPARVRYFGDYELLEEIDRGGMGIVYKARQVSLNRIAAVKVLLFGQFSSDEFVKRFRAEAEAAASLQHPNIVAIHEVGQHEGQHYFSMDYVEGGNLAELAREKPMPAKEAARSLKTIAEAIHYAHGRGVLHRDLKPSNVLIDPFDQPRITDFGLAKRLINAEPGTQNAELTVSGQVLGSPNYMPPEQADPARGPVGPASGVYSLGAILYHLLTGRPPFMSDAMEDTLLQLLNSDPVAPRLLNPSVAPDLETICLKCLNKEPARRYRSALALAEDLAHWLAGEPIEARPVSRSEKLWHWCRRQPAIAGLGATTILLLLALAIGSTVAAARFKKADARTTAQLWDSYLAQSRANRLSGQAGQRFDSLAVLTKAAAIKPSIELRNEAIACLALDDLQVVQRWPAKAPETLTILDPRFQLYATSSDRKTISLRRLDDHREVRLLQAKGVDVSRLIRFSPASRHIYGLSSRAGSVVWDIAKGALALRGLRQNCWGDFTPDNLWFAIGNGDGTISLYGLDSGKEIKRAEAGPPCRSLYCDPSGQRLACLREDRGFVDLRALDSGKLLTTFPITGHGYDCAWNPDGKYLAVTSDNGRVYLWDTQSGALQATMQGHDGLVVRASFSHGGDFLATMGWDDTVRLWEPLTGLQLIRHPGNSFQLLFSPDDKRLAFAILRDQVAVLEVASHPAFRRLTSGLHQASARSIAIDPYRRVLASAGPAGLCFWDLAHGEQIATLPDLDCYSVIFHPDGKSVITSGLQGLFRWPLQWGFEASNRAMRMGPRQALHPGDHFKRASVSADGNILAVANADRGEALVFDLSETNRPILRLEHTRVAFTDVSPDGQWVATGPFNASGVKIWQAKTGRLERQFPNEANANVLFSPDNRWLMMGSRGKGYQLREVGSWKPGPDLPDFNEHSNNEAFHKMAFSPGGEIVAIVRSMREVQLVETRTGRWLATLEAPRPAALAHLLFNADGSRLFALEQDHQIQLWDLRLVRAQLQRMNLDWEMPPYPPDEPPSAGRATLALEAK